jgi:imidazolonepropionase-like amidohydrolase
MRWKSVLMGVLGIFVALNVATPLWSQAQAPQVVAIHAGRLFDPKSGTNLTNQVVLISGDRITEVGPAANVQVPPGAKVIDLSQATVLPGLIDGHVHLTASSVGLQHQVLVGLYSATRSLNAGFTTQVAMGSHGGG